MPVEGNTQPLGLVHGGAYVVLAESLGSFAANVAAGEGRFAVGIEIPLHCQNADFYLIGKFTGFAHSCYSVVKISFRV
jgi:uncharacterized protein (TIGR00369 family)